MLRREAWERCRRRVRPPALASLLLARWASAAASSSSSSSAAAAAPSSSSAAAAAPSAPTTPSAPTPSTTAPPAPLLLPGLSKLLVANRGEIACRIIGTARRLGVRTVAVYSSADRDAPHVRQADEAVCLGPAASASSYLDHGRVLEAARITGATAVHPGYGFLSESHEFASAAQQAGLVFVGPPPRAIRDLGDKIESKRIALAAGLSTIPGWVGDIAADPGRALAVAEEIGWPVIVKASRGGGGKGMRVARSRAELEEAIALSRREAEAAFGDSSLLIEKYVERARHVEVQVIADAHGGCVYFPERDCSVQRRNQKVIEESPSPYVQGSEAAAPGANLPANLAMRKAMGEQAVRLARAVGYASAGTVEFVVDAGGGGGGGGGGGQGAGGGRGTNFYFLEMNTRLQVEHPITEAVSGGIDLVELMLRVAAGERLPGWLTQERAARVHGAAMEARLYAEDPARGFLPSPGTLIAYREPRWSPRGAATAASAAAAAAAARAGSLSDAASPASSSAAASAASTSAEDPALAHAGAVPSYIRLDRGVSEGGEVPVHYDPMLGKLVAAAPTREAARRLLAEALDSFVVRGVATNLAAVRRMLDLPAFVSGDYDTGLIAREFGVGGMPTMGPAGDAAGKKAGGGGGGSGGGGGDAPSSSSQPLLSTLDPLAFPLPEVAEREVVAAAVFLHAEAARRRRAHGGRQQQGVGEQQEEEELSVSVAGGSPALPRRSLRALVRSAPAAHVGPRVAATGRAIEVELPDAVVHVYAAEDAGEAGDGAVAGGGEGAGGGGSSYSPYLRRLVVGGRPVTIQLAERSSSASSSSSSSSSSHEPGLGPGVVSRRGALLLQHRGAQREVLVERPAAAALAAHMPSAEELARRRARERGAAVRSPMTGTVAALRVKPGDRVREGDEVAVVSAMKMMMPLLAPRDGVIAAVGEGVQEGGGVSADAVIVTLVEEEKEKEEEEGEEQENGGERKSGRS